MKRSATLTKKTVAAMNREVDALEAALHRMDGWHTTGQALAAFLHGAIESADAEIEHGLPVIGDEIDLDRIFGQADPR